jgi:hypothetical protein
MASARTLLAEKAATVYGQGVAGRLEGEARLAFNDLGVTIRYRLSGDRQAEDVLSNVERTPMDEQSRKALAHELSYYTEVDPAFGDTLDSVVSRLTQLVEPKR